MKKVPLSPDEFDAKCRELVRRCPWLSETSGYRSTARNRDVNGHPESKHLIGMARDYVANTQAGLEAGADEAGDLGLWFVVHDKGSGNHLHVQGLAPGQPPYWWVEKYG